MAISRMLAVVMLVFAGVVTTRAASAGEHPCEGVQKTYVDAVTGVVHNCWRVCSNPLRDFRRYCKTYCRDFYQCMEALKSREASQSPASSKTTSVSGVVAEAVAGPLPTRDRSDINGSIWWGSTITVIAICTVSVVTFLSVVHCRRRKTPEKKPENGQDSGECGVLISDAPGHEQISQDEVNNSLLHDDETENPKLDQPTGSDSGVGSLEDKEKESIGDAQPDVKADSIRDSESVSMGTGAIDHSIVLMTEGSHCQPGERREPPTVCQDTQSFNIVTNKHIVNILCVNGRGNMPSYVDYETTAPEPIREPPRTLGYTEYGAKIITAESSLGDNSRFAAPRYQQCNETLSEDGCGDDAIDNVSRSSAYISPESLHLGSICDGGDVYLGIHPSQPEVTVNEETQPKMI